MKKKLITLLQFALGIGLITMIFRKLHSSGDLTKLVQATQEAAGRWPLICVGVLGFLLCLLFCVERWNLLLKAQGLVLPFRKVMALFCVGQFFNAFMFGATGGDVIKAYYVATETHHRRTEVIATVFIDRIMGLIALVFMTALIALVRLPVFFTSRPMKIALAIIVFQFLAVSAGILVVVRRNSFENWPLFRRLEERTALGRVLSRAYNSFQICLRNPTLFLKTTGLSFVNHLSFLVCTFYLGMALGLPMDFVDYITVFPVINIVAAMPITPSGLGTRESMSLFLLSQFGVSPARAVTLSLFMYVTVLFWSLAGGIVYFFYIYRRGRTSAADIKETE